MTYTPPHSLSAETTVLGACMISERAADIAADLLDPRDFYRSAHGLVFATIQELRGKGETADPITVGDLLGTRNRLDEIGGAVALTDLTNRVSSPKAIQSYCDIVSGKAAQRNARDLAMQFADKATTTEDLQADVDALTTALTSRRGSMATQDPDDVAADFYARLSGDTVKAWRTGWPNVDKLYRLPQGLLTVLTGLPSSGKSTWLDVAIYNVCRQDDTFRVAYFSPESAPAGKHLLNLVHTSLGTPPQHGSEGLAEHIEKHRAWWQERCVWINDDRDNTPSAVLAVARQQARKGLNLLVVDPYNNLSPDSRQSAGERQDLYIQDLLRRFKRFARETGVSVVIVAHPRQVPIIAGTEAVFQIPTAAHISGGQEWWNHADSVVCIWRNQAGEHAHEFGPPERVKVVVQKVRDTGVWGRQGTALLEFEEDKRRYKEVHG